VNLTEQIFAYCERQGPELYAEPLNALSNAAFFYWAWRLWRKVNPHKPYLAARVRWLAGLIALVGVGSLAFHTTAARWASILDALIIGIFNVSYLIIFLRVVPQWPRYWAFAGGVVFIIVDRIAAVHLPSDVFNGSVLYLPAVAVLIGLTVYARLIAPQAGQMMAGALAVFGVSLLARTVDPAVCASWSWGTHFVWHLLNAWVLYQLSRAVALAARGQTLVVPPRIGETIETGGKL
jgi:hypothetical protein